MSKRKRQPRTTSGQHEAYISFIDEHPDILDTMTKDYTNLWKELVARLNMYGPVRTLKQWQDNLKNWEYGLKSKKRAQIAHAHGTGGGPPTKPLSAFEERALDKFGRISVVGDQQIEVLGLTIVDNSDNSSTSNAINIDASDTSNTPNLNEHRHRAKKQKTSIEILSETLTSAINTRNETDERNQKSLETVAQAIDKIGTAMLAFADVFKKNHT